MLFEYAVQPDTLRDIAKSCRDCNYFTKEFQIGRPKVLSGFPRFKQLRRILKEQYSQCDNDLHQSRLDELILFVDSCLTVKRSADYDRQRCWDDNVTDEHNRVPFDEVLSNSAIGNNAALKLESFLAGTDDVGKPENGAVVATSNAADMAAAVSNLLRLSEKLFFVDPFFTDRPSYWNTLEEFILRSQVNRPVGRLGLEILYGDGSEKKGHASPTPQYLLSAFSQKLPALKGKCDITFSSYRMPSKRAHNRYLLSDIAGVSVGSGLGENSDQGDDDFSLLNRKSYELRWNDYALKKECEITDTASNILE